MTPMPAALLKISQLARQAGLPPSTIRHYANLGLISSASATEGGQRLFDGAKTLARLARVKRLASRGLALPEIKAELDGAAPHRILVVDDEQEVVELVEDALKGPRLEVRAARDGFTAGRIMADYLPDLVVLDIMMPGLDGFEVCRQIRRDPHLAGVKILAVTGHDTPENFRRMTEAGADKYLAKPFNVKDLTDAVSELLGTELSHGKI
jgi:CheY-like chemotaxis protein